MTVPLVQGTLQASYFVDYHGDTQETSKTRAAVYAAAILPLVHACSAPYAEIIYSHMSLGNVEQGSFRKVKHSLEQNYDCLGITCADVGGLVDPTGSAYYEDAEPCGIVVNSQQTLELAGSTNANTKTTKTKNKGPNYGLVFGLLVGVVIVSLIAVLLASHNWKTQKGSGSATAAPSPPVDELDVPVEDLPEPELELEHEIA